MIDNKPYDRAGSKAGNAKTLYFDCFSGASGDMIVGALLDLGLNEEMFRNELKKIPLDGYDINIRKINKSGICATKFDVLTEPEEVCACERHLDDIEQIIDASRLATEVRDKSKAVFRLLAAAEAKVHGTTPEKVHFHEVGAVDSIIDIVGVVIALYLLGVDKIVASPLPMGRGFVTCRHGLIPVPAPATVELLKGRAIYGSEHEGETVTPTGAALLSALAGQFGSMPALEVERVGYGAGTRDYGVPNVVRAIIGKEVGDSKKFNGTVVVLEANIDDMNPEFFDYVLERLFENGALDAFLVPIHMKKNRPAVLIRVICIEEDARKLAEILFLETSTIGVRFSRWDRFCLERETRMVQTEYGEIRVKTALLHGNVVNEAPEYEDCRKRSREYGAPLKKVYLAALRAAEGEH
ncbi:nickel pincer cofactor biosynthesis protein LarC [Phosphitispora sp. TUW77]|uniref:nickel pincer cofactor biosynthesis protein LarC n=1 Tax=Phosphitispora sp. TUW77 TaxID=3152361 RepID=UPI003AB8CA33